MPSSRENVIAQKRMEEDANATTSGDSPKVGMDIEVAEFYRKGEGHPWTEERPVEMKNVKDISKMKLNCALAVRRQKDRGTGEFVLHSITVHSPLIRGFLHKVFDGYRGISTRLRDLSFYAPFREFFYRWDHFQRYIAQEKDEITLKHIELLQNIITPEIQPHVVTRDDLLSQSLITFEYLWAIFEPGVEVFSRLKDYDRVFIYENSRVRCEGYELTCKYVDFNGSSFGYTTTNLFIPMFNGVLPLHELNVLPADLHLDPERLRGALLRRGRCFEKMTGVHYKSYSGLYQVISMFGEQKKHMDGGRIIIDARMFYQQNPSSTPPFWPLEVPSENPQAYYEEGDSSEDDGEDSDSLDRSYLPPPPPPPPLPFPTFPVPPPPPIAYINDTLKIEENIPPLSEQDCRLCTPILRGFNLFSHAWGSFFIDQVREIEFSQDAFPRLVLPYDYKELILAITKSQLSCEDTFDDIIQGKGQGIIMLLQGEPGVGKTLTAEATAEEMRRPFYAVSAGELGYSADEVEKNLRNILDITAKWRAVLLIDECDIFLEKRTLSDINRNKLVAVFLRLLEYFKGVLFLTTNRVSTFDPAFQSRIHLTIDYPQLDFSSRKHVWRTFVPSAIEKPDLEPQNSLSDADIAELSKMELNGREIKNIVKTARLLSTSKGVSLSIEHVRTVLNIKARATGG